MHDERFFTGGCHYAIQCEGFLTDCSNCPRLPRGLRNLPKKNLNKARRKLITANDNLRFIAPSKWIAGEAKRSTVLANSQIFFIPNTLGPEHYTKVEHSKRLRRDKGVLWIGIASMDDKSFIKGGDLLSSVMDLVKIQKLKIKFLFMNQIKEPANIDCLFWNEIDYLLVLSRADNSPNVIHEAKHRSVPVIMTNVGGMPELLSSPPDILLEENPDCEDVVQLLDQLASHTKELDVSQTRLDLVKYTNGNVSKLIDLYLSIIN